MIGSAHNLSSLVFINTIQSLTETDISSHNIIKMNLHHALLLMLAVSVSPAYSTLQGGYAEDAISAAATTVDADDGARSHLRHLTKVNISLTLSRFILSIYYSEGSCHRT